MLLEKLFGFYHVALEQSFTKASHKTNISQPNLSKYISSLEKHFNKKLVYKQNRKVHLTDEGKVLFNTAKKMLDDYQTAEELIRLTSNDLAGPLRIGTGLSLAQSWCVDIFSEFSLKYPDIKLIITGTDRENELAKGSFDVVIGPKVFDDPTKYIEQHFYSIDWCFYASKDYIKKHGKPKTLEELQTHRLIAYNQKERHVYGNVNPHLYFNSDDFLPKLPDYAINSGLGLARATAKGVGIGLLQKKAPFMDHLDLVALDGLGDFEQAKIYLSYAKHLKSSKKIKVFTEFFLDAFKKQYS